MEALMEGLQTNEVGWRAGGGNRLFELLSNCRSVITASVHCAFAHIGLRDLALMLEDSGGQFQIGIGDHAGAILVGDQLVGQIFWDMETPQAGVQLVLQIT
jgi:hypothetical protein